MNGSRSAAITGGRMALSTPITAAATNAAPKPLTSAPGTIQQAASSATVARSHERSRRTGPMCGRPIPQTGFSPYVVVVITSSSGQAMSAER
jgi:hypothetical protein